jgi:peptide/nickel transport system ATP-binding protein
MSVLELVDVEVEYKRRGQLPVRALMGASIAVGPGEIVGLVGESGCGKSTLARTAVGLVAPRRGHVLFEGRTVPPLTRRARASEHVRLQMVFQDPFSSLNPRRTIGDQIADGMMDRPKVKSNRRARVGELLEQVGLAPSSADRYPHQFSGGQRQRVAIARVLATSPSAIVLDEPFSALDASVQAQIANLLVELSRDLHIAMLLISHDLAIVRQVAHRISVMYLGSVVEEGETEAVWSNPLHPYTEALIGAAPMPDGKGTLPTVLGGEVPDPSRPPHGCRFNPRCPHAFARCFEETPDLESLEGRKVACWLHRLDEPGVTRSRSRAFR